ncbi:MAG: rhomboid family intramembrane serine protease [Pseudomonadota bacterium]
MFLPIHDANSLKRIEFQYVTVLLILANVIVFVMTQIPAGERLIASFSVIPRELIGVNYLGPANGPNDVLPIAEGFTMLSYMFLHSDIFHLVGNMLFLWVFGDNVEDAMGHLTFACFYLLCGVFAGLAHAWMLPTSSIPMIGASGATAGVIAAYLMLHPRVNVWVLVMKFVPVQVSAAIALGFWVGWQIVMVLLPQVGPVAWWAHVGGLAAGAVLVLFLRRRGVPLFS